ncbi:MAG TPA: PHP domain-containing protein, partial [Bryobacteraceae bacterium]|nr:PHP domain-containing protein [Bryobacteraceae bacterium]
MTEYVELHARSAFSFLRGASLPEALAACASSLGMPAMALLDRDGVYGAPRFHFAAEKAGIRAHIGAEITAAGGEVFPLLVRNRTGYQNLCRLVTRMKLRAKKYEAAATREEIAEHAEGLIALTEGPRERIEWLIHSFGRENVYAEIQRHMDREEEARNQALIETARSLRIPLVATNGVAHAIPAEREILDVLTSVRNKVTLETAGRLLAANNERHLKPGAAMERLFADLPEAIAQTAELSSRLEFTLTDLGYEF